MICIVEVVHGKGYSKELDTLGTGVVRYIYDKAEGIKIKGTVSLEIL